MPSTNAVDVEDQIQSNRWNDTVKDNMTRFNQAPTAPTIERDLISRRESEWMVAVLPWGPGVESGRSTEHSPSVTYPAADIRG